MLAAAMVTGIQVGAAMVATRFVADDIGPASLALLRYAIAAACLLPFLVTARPARFTPGDLAAIAVLGIVQFGILIALLNIALIHMTSGRTALVFATFPLLTMLLAAMLGRESLTAVKTSGVLISIVGVAVALGETIFAETGADEWLGALCAFAAALCGAVCSVLYQPYLERYPTLNVSIVAMLASVVFLAGLSFAEGLFSAPPALPSSALAAVIFIGLSSGGGYLLWLWALKHTTPTRVTVFLSLSPVTAALLGWLLLGEEMTVGVLVGLIAVMFGLWLATSEVKFSAAQTNR